MTSRGLAPVLGVVLLVAITLLLAAAVAALMSIGPPTDDVRQATIDGTVEIGANQTNFTLEHRGGDPLPVDRLDLHIAVDGEPLRHQPSLPLDYSPGFDGFASGPFNPRSPNDWAPGERGTLRMTDNAPVPGPDSTVTVTVSFDGRVISERDLTHAS